MDEPTAKRRGRSPKPRGPKPPPLRGRGRPKLSLKLLSTDRWRYLYALAEATIQRNAIVEDASSELGVCVFFASLKECRPLGVGEFISGHEPVIEDFRALWRQGLPIQMVHQQWDSMPAHARAVANETYVPGDRWREKARINARAEDIQRKLGNWRVAQSPNRQWLKNMVKAMQICIAGIGEAAWYGEALAGDIGESRYFEAKLRPLLIEQAALVRVGKNAQDLSLDQLFGLISPS